MRKRNLTRTNARNKINGREAADRRQVHEAQRLGRVGIYHHQEVLRVEHESPRVRPIPPQCRPRHLVRPQLPYHNLMCSVVFALVAHSPETKKCVGSESREVIALRDYQTTHIEASKGSQQDRTTAQLGAQRGF